MREARRSALISVVRVPTPANARASASAEPAAALLAAGAGDGDHGQLGADAGQLELGAQQLHRRLVELGIDVDHRHAVHLDVLGPPGVAVEPADRERDQGADREARQQAAERRQ